MQHTYELYHFGIKGQKWGVRRYQNKDGTLTTAGKARYSADVEKAKGALKDAKQNKKVLGKEYSKAYNRYNLVPTKDNHDKALIAFDKLKAANAELTKAKLDYRIAKNGVDLNAPKSKHRTMLEEKYQKEGYTPEQASLLAGDRIRTEKIIAGAAVMTVASCAAYAVNKRIKDRTDQIIKSGDLLQRIEMRDTGGQLHDVSYISKGDRDNKRYEGLLGLTRKMQNGQAYVMKLEASNDIKVASKDKAAKMFGDLYKNDPEFRESVKGSISMHFNGRNKANVDNLSDRNIKKLYENFNSNLPILRERGSGVEKKFYSKLKDAGYGAIQDINDMKYSGYNAKNPLIVFDNAKKNITVKNVKELTNNKEILKKGLLEAGKGSVENMGNRLLSSPYTSLALGGTAAAMAVSDRSGTNNEKTKK